MKQLFFSILLFPLLSASQRYTYYDAHLSGQFAKSSSSTGYGIGGSGNIEVISKVYLGLSLGAVQVKPFVSNPAFYANARLTCFTSEEGEKLAPFGLFEAGKLFYNEKNFGGSSSQQLKGGLNFFTGVGVRFGAQRFHPFFAIGYAGFNYDNNTYRNNAVEFSQPYRFRRVAIKLGVMLPR